MVKFASLSILAIAALVLNACGGGGDSTSPAQPITVTAINPASGPLAGGTSVTIAGTNFIDISGVTIGGNSVVNLTVVSSTQITGTSSAATNAGPNDVVVTSSSHSSGVCKGCFTYDLPVTHSRDQITAGGDHTCALTNAGAAYCWGSNSYGRLGNGSETNSLTAVAVSGGLTFTTIAAGSTHTCALTNAGDAYCWGNNVVGQLGNGSTNRSSVPVAVSGGLKFLTLAATGDHTCGLVSSGAAYCWGKNDFGQLGNGTTSGSTVPGSTTPMPVSGGLHFIALDAGGYHTCGIVGSGAAYCWGLNESGELGNGSQGGNAGALVPTAVSGGLVFTAIFAGYYHTCGLANQQTVYCWGSNLFGGLGDGSPMNNGATSGPDFCPTYPNTGGCSVRPIPMSPGLGEGFHAFSLGLGGYHTCGLVTDGVAYCWGANTYGQVGSGVIGNTSNRQGVAGSATFPGFRLFKTIAASSTNYTCGIATTGDAAYCWGRNDVGQLGDGTTGDSPTPVNGSGFPPP